MLTVCQTDELSSGLRGGLADNPDIHPGGAHPQLTQTLAEHSPDDRTVDALIGKEEGATPRPLEISLKVEIHVDFCKFAKVSIRYQAVLWRDLLN